MLVVQCRVFKPVWSNGLIPREVFRFDPLRHSGFCTCHVDELILFMCFVLFTASVV
jgi:hypothetical protein